MNKSIRLTMAFMAVVCLSALATASPISAKEFGVFNQPTTFIVQAVVAPEPVDVSALRSTPAHWPLKADTLRVGDTHTKAVDKTTGQMPMAPPAFLKYRSIATFAAAPHQRL